MNINRLLGRLRPFELTVTLTFVLFFLLAGAAFAAEGVPSPQHGLPIPNITVWALIAGALAPIASYLLNSYGPHTEEPTKTFVFALVAAAAGAITQLIDTGGHLGFDMETLQVIGTAVVAAFSAHAGVWTRSGLATKLGAGQNRNLNPKR